MNRSVQGRQGSQTQRERALARVWMLREELAYYIGRGDFASAAEVEEDLEQAIRYLRKLESQEGVG